MENVENIISLKQKEHKLIPIKLTRKVFGFIVFILLFELFLFPASPALASISETEDDLPNIPEVIEEITENTNNSENFINNLPKTEEWKTMWTGYYSVTAYNSEVAQCDDTPCITANGFNGSVLT